MTDWPEPTNPLAGGDRQPSPRVREAKARLWNEFKPRPSGDFGLLPQLPFDAVLARARAGEALACTPRLLELLVGHQLSVVEARVAVDNVVEAGSTMQADQAMSVQNLLEAWWLQALQREVGEHAPGFPPAVVLGLVSRWASPMTRWLGAWLDRLDGPGAKHLVDTIAALSLSGPTPISTASSVDGMPSQWQVVAPLVSEVWSGLEDRRGQLMGWARSETVVNGLVLIGAIHLNCDHYSELLSDVLDLLLEG